MQEEAVLGGSASRAWAAAQGMGLWGYTLQQQEEAVPVSCAPPQ